MPSDEKLIIFIKAPVPGQVKTRLHIPPEDAARIYREWAKGTCDSARILTPIPFEIAYDPHPDFPDPSWLTESPLPFGERVRVRGNFQYFYQKGPDLGSRLLHAFSQSFENGAKRVVIIGSDSPGLPRTYLVNAFRELNHFDLVLGPAEDGGYYLIGLRDKVFPELFRGISWSTPEVYGQTMRIAKILNLRVHVLPEYFDVDRPEDLKRIPIKRGIRKGAV